MGDAGKNKTTVSTTISIEVAKEIEMRAAALGKSKGAYMRDLLLDWYERGAPPVGKLDELVQQDQRAKKQADYYKMKGALPEKKAKRVG